MRTPLRPEDIHRTALLAVHDGSQPTLEAALTAHANTVVVLCIDERTCADVSGQAALLTAVVTAVRAFGRVLVYAAMPEAPITTGLFTGRTLADAVAMEGARCISADSLDEIDGRWPIVLIGADTPAPPAASRATSSSHVLRVSWSGWVARVRASAAPAPEATGPRCVLASIAAAAMGISEAFGVLRAVPGSDAGFRTIVLNLWNPSGDADDRGPELRHAPNAWWLVGLGHLGQAYSWAISWLGYPDPATVQIVLQDVDRTVPGNHSTGVLTPSGSHGLRKTRLVAAGLEHAGFDTRIVERRLGADLRVAEAERHVALLGVDNLPTRQLTSGVGWLFAVDIGLGSGAANFGSLLMRRFPGARRSDEVKAWAQTPVPVAVPSSPAFADLKEHHDECGVVELAGKAVGASFVGVVAACIAVAEATRELHGGIGFDLLTLDLTTMVSDSAPASHSGDVVSCPLLGVEI